MINGGWKDTPTIKGKLAQHSIECIRITLMPISKHTREIPLRICIDTQNTFSELGWKDTPTIKGKLAQHSIECIRITLMPISKHTREIPLRICIDTQTTFS